MKAGIFPGFSDRRRMHIEEIKEKIKAADMVLVGIGEELERKDVLEANPAYCRGCKDMAEHGIQWLYPMVSRYFLKEDALLKQAYQKLAELLEGKNYFVISTAVNGLIGESGLKQDRITEPCGTCLRMQCGNGCEGSVRQTSEEMFTKCISYIRGEKSWAELNLPVCESCKSGMECNSLYAEHYLEEGYRPSWERYKKWLQGTVNRKLCVLELGVGMQYAGLIRFPQEKIVGLNQKAELIRVHHLLSQLPEEIHGRGIGISENAVDFLIRL